MRISNLGKARNMQKQRDFVEKEYRSGDLSYIDAIESLTANGFDSLTAEALVLAWDEDTDTNRRE